jgi:hypothetical protein
MQLQLKQLEESAIAKGLCVNVGKCATMVCNGDNTGAHQLRYQGATLPVVQEFRYLGTWMDREMSMPLATYRARGDMMAARRDLVPIALNAGMRDLRHAMTVLVKTYVTQKAMYASQVWGPDVLHLSPCGKFNLWCERCVSMPCLMDELSIKPLQMHWFKACVKFFLSLGKLL